MKDTQRGSLYTKVDIDKLNNALLVVKT